jgi:hypothetical protein
VTGCIGVLAAKARQLDRNPLCEHQLDERIPIPHPDASTCRGHVSRQPGGHVPEHRDE